ncbi:MAG: PQQ-dependent sugar dehydrogenase [Jannaschia helgolandensis]|jgi:glucose/arabinose dehydrogenase|uniref:Glucose/arabinose dehydrogenase, beta-propeller fold n=1 Tax=Jannaschia helgolandensis TaxID=188906 RepID=A0A1H7RFE2_9RHOB|nr:PQQ-dependent sugar dehydrogenase [Jannaschia helgolandensis]SEL58634.1 Glucose/arabinose dehydrogenase, beta-propeller fold [Jannaschia helgolandensis]
MIRTTTTLAFALISTMATAQQHSGRDENRVLSSAGPIQIEELATLEFPWGMEALPESGLLITEKVGALRRWSEADGLSDPISGLPEIEYQGQGGLLDVALHPDFAENGLVYLYYVMAAEDQPEEPALDNDPRLGPFVNTEDRVLKGGVVWRARLDGDTLVEGKELWRQEPFSVGLGQFGGRLVFRDDGTLIITSGDRQRFEPAQSYETNLGKILRINDDGSIPEDNPYWTAGSPLDAVWSLGHRNPLGAAIRPETGELYTHEMGPLYGDELNVPVPSGNYGWPEVSNGENYNRQPIAHHETALERFERPLFYWRPAVSPSGLMFYNGDMFADWKGNAFLGGLSVQALVRVSFDGENVSGSEQINLYRRVRDVMQADDGAILILTDYEDGKLLRLTPAE